MDIQMVFYISLVLFLISLIGLLASSRFITVFISLQVMTVSAIINFLNFSLWSAVKESGINILIILGLMTFYLLEFSVVFYIYSTNTGNLRTAELSAGFRLISFDKSDWWGEDRS